MVETSLNKIGVVFIARGLDPNHRARVTRFIDSYLCHPAGINHKLYILYKNFASLEDLAWTREQFTVLVPMEILDYLHRITYGVGPICRYVNEPILCPLNGTTEIMYNDWLKRLYDVFARPDVGLVGCSGSSDNSTLHVRDTAILVDRIRYLEIAKPFDWKTKKGWLDFENGPNNLTQQIMRDGKKVFVVEADRIRAPHEWPVTTYRGNLHNVLVHDRGARDWHDL